MNEDRELRWVTEEEHRGVVEYPIPVPFIGIKLDREASRITSAVWRAFLAANGGKASYAFGLLANALEHINGSLRTFSCRFSDSCCRTLPNH